MPIKPIDLQTLFMQLGQVGKQQAAEKDGALLHASLHGALVKKLEAEAAKAVQKPLDDQAATPPVDDEAGAGGQGSEKKREGDKPAEPDLETITDASLGGHVDISG